MPAKKTPAAYPFSSPGVAYSSSDSAAPAAARRTAGSDAPSSYSPSASSRPSHTRSDSSGRSSAVPYNTTATAASSTSALLSQRSQPDMHTAHGPYSPRASHDVPASAGGAAPLLAGYSGASAVAGGRFDPEAAEQLSDTSDWPPAAAGGRSFAGRGSVSSVGSVGSMGYTPRHQTGYASGSVASHATSSMGASYALGGDPSMWNRSGSPEPDDYLHNPDPKRDRKGDGGGSVFTARGLMNLGCLTILTLALFTLFAGYPIITEVRKHEPKTMGAFNLGGVNGSGQVPEIIGNFGLIDNDTPQDAYSIVSGTGETWELVFSDEFEQEGRTFYPGDDPYWEAADLHAWGTNDLQWYAPEQSTTRGGKLVQTLEKRPSHDLDYISGSIRSWNKFCFTGGRIEASIRLPGRPSVQGLWPAFWTMGNLGRANYGGVLDGTWPYSYDSCDVGTLANQTLNGQPESNLHTGVQEQFNFELSYLPGQLLSACTCPDDPIHPGPKKADGTFRGRSSPEIDVLEAQVANGKGEVSLSAQWAPFDSYYMWNNQSYADIYLPDKAYLNTYRGGTFQQTTSVVAETNPECYALPPSGGEGCFAVYAFEYELGDDGYITWFNDGEKTWTYHNGGMGPNPSSGVGNRPIPYEPMYIIFNLAISENFGWIDYDNLDPDFPFEMEIDYVRVYQHPDRVNLGCDPDDAPTAKYIAHFNEAYNNPNITTWDQMTNNAPKPKNRLIDTC